MPHVIPSLPYAYDALEPHIDGTTMEIHHTKHHQGYVNKLNAALDGHDDLQQQTVEGLVASLDELPQPVRTAVRNHGGGHLNHTLFWAIMSPDGGGQPDGDLRDALETEFGDFGKFGKQFAGAAAGLFGSGWTWLTVDGAGMHIETTSNQDNPLMHGRTPILGLDVWEHAYYLRYRNRRAEYIAAWWNVVNWAEVARRFQEAHAVATA